MAESFLLKHQLVISSRARRRAPNLNSFNRSFLVLDRCSFRRAGLLAVVLKPRTLLRFHEASRNANNRWLSSRDCGA